MRVLVVDDDDRRRQLLVARLRKAAQLGQTEIVDVDCVDHAKRNLAATYFDVLILDVVLPKRSSGAADANLGLQLLGQIARSHRLKKPGKIIGVTAHLADIGRFRDEFAKLCFMVIEAPAGVEWMGKLLDALAYAKQARLAESVDTVRARVLTVHGIRTFGPWQQDFQSVISREIPGMQFHSYKYGLFSLLAFVFPFYVRGREVAQLARALEDLFLAHPREQFMLFAHSFGTYLVAHALRKLCERRERVPIHTIVICGSVLPSRFDWRFLRPSNTRIVNECADDDYVLWLSEAFVWGMGMAGKRGFFGVEDRQLVNRYFTGGHNSCVRSREFMKTYWLPLFDTKNVLHAIDQRKQSTVKHEIVEDAVVFIGWLKPWLYGALAVIFVVAIGGRVFL
jgi:CheY-like chemotaxis protein/pimeloyl-ACP methyl ester carboxylesterase